MDRHLFQGRYKSILVEHGPDIKEVVRYIDTVGKFRKGRAALYAAPTNAGR